MKVICDIKKIRLLEGCVCTIGNFDGVHLGHKAILKKVKKESIKLKVPSVVITFHPHPLAVLFPEKKTKLICTRKQKFEEINKLSVDYLIEIPFDLNFARMTGEEFVQNILIKKLFLKKIVIGSNFNFGNKKSGNSKVLKKMGRKYGFSVNVIKPLNYIGHQISSTNIRKFLFRGKIEDANKMLGRFYSITGKVIHGTKRGKEMGVPTINLDKFNDLLVDEGIYAGFAKIKGYEKKFLCAISIGRNPTFEGREIVTEAHLIDFSRDIYGKEVEIFFLKKIRKQKKFDTIEELVKNIKKDIEITKKISEKAIE